MKKDTLYKNSFFAYKNSFFAYKNSFFAYKNSFFAYKNSFFKSLTLVFKGSPEYLKYLKYLNILNSSACEKFCLVLEFYLFVPLKKISEEKPKGEK